MRGRGKVGLLIIPLVLFVLASQVALCKKPPDEKLVRPTHYGRVEGYVHDAITGAPIVEATVIVEDRGEFPKEGRTVAKTNEYGKYSCQALLGRVSSSVHLGRFLSTGLLGLLTGGAKKKTKRIDVSQLNMRVIADGYNPFEGVVPCRGARADQFRVWMEPILLTPEGDSTVSTAMRGWGAVGITDFHVEPSVVRADEKVEVSAVVSVPKGAKIGRVRLLMTSEVLGRKELKRLDKDEVSQGEIRFGGQFKARKSKKEVIADYATVVLIEAPYYIDASSSRKVCLVQLVKSRRQERTARMREQAWVLCQQGKNTEAEQLFKQICERHDSLSDDLERLALIAGQVHDYETAIWARQQLLEKADEKEKFGRLEEYARTLAEAGRWEELISEVTKQVEQVPEKEQPKKIPASLVALVGIAYVELGELDKAEQISERLKAWKAKAAGPQVVKFRKRLRAARAERAAQLNPNDAEAQAEYGRVLMDMGRWAEAINHLRNALKLKPDMPMVRWYLGYALVNLTGSSEEATENFEKALAEAEKQVVDEKGKKTKDFFAWHRYALLLYRKYAKQAAAGDEASGETLAQFEEAIVEALKCARAGATVSSGEYTWSLGYISPMLVAITGFAYPEAVQDYILYDSLRILQDHPDNYLAHYNVASALNQLGHTDLAEAAIKRCLELKPDFLPAKFVLAQIAVRMGRRQQAYKLLREVVKLNPRHPRANLLLAKLLMEDGDMAAAAACLAEHAKYYGEASLE